jgi:hypothetical protein
VVERDAHAGREWGSAVIGPSARDHDQWRAAEWCDLCVQQLAGDDVDTVLNGVSAGFGQQSPDTRRLCSPDREQPPVLVAPHRLDERHASGLIGMRMREQPHQQPAVGVAHQDVRRRDPGALQQRVQVTGLISGVVDPGYWKAVAKARTVIRARACGPAQRRLHFAPFRAIEAEPGFQQHRWAARAVAPQIQASSAADGYQSPPAPPRPGPNAARTAALPESPTRAHHSPSRAWSPTTSAITLRTTTRF